MAGFTFKRVEHKFRIDPVTASEVLEKMRPYLQDDIYPTYSLHSIYCDSSDDILIQRSIEKPLYKEKMRLRSYGDPKDGDPVFMEIKKKYDGIIYKRRIRMDEASVLHYFRENDGLEQYGQIGREIDYMRNLYNVYPKVFICYERRAFSGIDDADLRVTFDSNMYYRSSHISMHKNGQEKRLLPNHDMIMEIKCMDRYPLWLNEILTDMHLYRKPFSKYRTAYQLITAEKRKQTAGSFAYTYETMKERKDKQCLLQY